MNHQLQVGREFNSQEIEHFLILYTLNIKVNKSKVKKKGYHIPHWFRKQLISFSLVHLLIQHNKRKDPILQSLIRTKSSYFCISHAKQSILLIGIIHNIQIKFMRTNSLLL